MANSKFSGAGFATGQTLTSASSIAGLEQTGPGVYENRRWTQEEFFQTSVPNGVGFLKFIFTGSQDCSFNHNGLTVNGTAYNQSNGSYQIVADTGNATSSAGISFKTSSALTEKMTITETISSKVNHEFEEAIIDGSSQTGTNGQVLSSTGTGVAWITPTSSSTLQQVLDAGNTAEEDPAAPTPLVGKINLTTSGGKDATFEANGVTNNSNNALEIDGNNGILTLISNTKVNLLGPSGGLSVDNTGSNVMLYANNADDLQLNINGTGNISMYLGTTATAPAVGDVLAAKTTGGALEWKSLPSKTPQTLTPGTTTWAIGSGYNAILNNNTATTLSITGVVDGDTGTLIVNNSGGGTISWPSLSVWPGGTPPTLSTGTDIFSFIYVFPVYYWSFGQDFS